MMLCFVSQIGEKRFIVSVVEWKVRINADHIILLFP